MTILPLTALHRPGAAGHSKEHQFSSRKKNLRALCLIVCTFSYLLLGAAVFDALESHNDREKRARIQTSRKRIVEKYGISDEDMEKFESAVDRWARGRKVSAEDGYQWKFAGAFYFAAIVTVCAIQSSM